MVDAVEQFHSAGLEGECASRSQNEVDGQNPSAADADARMNLAVGGTDGFGCEQLHVAYSEDRQNCDCEEYYSQSSEPLGQAAPEQKPVRKRLDVAQNARACGGESRDGFEEGVGEGRDVPCQEERQTSE